MRRVKAYVEGNDHTTTNATLTIYECSSNVDNTATPATEAFDTQQGRDGVITSADLDPTKIYKVELTGGGDFPSLLEIGFQTPLAKITLADDADNSDAISAAAESGKLYDVTLSGRTLYKDGRWNTLCLPFDVTISGSPLDGDGVDVRTLSSSEFNNSDGTLTLDFTPASGGGAVTTIEAGKPYIIKWANTGANLTEHDLVFNGVTIVGSSTNVTSQGVNFIGTYSPVNIYTNPSNKLYLGVDNTLYYPTDEDFKVNAFRAYFELVGDLVFGTPESSIKAFVLNFGDEETTSIELSPSIINKNDDTWYSLDGIRLSKKPIEKGIYIHNGRKEVLK